MIEHIWSVLCGQSVVDRFTNNVSLFSVLEQISIPAPPSIEGTQLLLLPYEIVSLWSRTETTEPVSGKARIRVLGPDGQELLQREHELDLRASERTRHRIVFRQLPLVGTGYYHFAIDLYDEESAEWKPVASLPLQVNIDDGKARSAPFGGILVHKEPEAGDSDS